MSEFDDLMKRVMALTKMIDQMKADQEDAQRKQRYAMETSDARDAWQVSEEDNVDASNGLLVDIYIPPNGVTRRIRQVLLRVKLKAFRSYSSTTASGGSTTSGPSSASSSSSGGSTVGTNTDVAITDYGSINPIGFVKADTSTAAHDHGITNGTVLAVDGGGTATYSTFAGDTHLHDDYAHGHEIDLPAHTHPIPHTHDIAAHTHGVTAAITTGATATGCTVVINGTDRTTALTGGATFSADEDELDITQYMTATGYNTIEITSTGLGRIRATAFVNLYLNNR